MRYALEVELKQWVKKLVDQFEIDWGGDKVKQEASHQMDEIKASLIFMIDTYSKHLVSIENHNLRKTRDTFDDFAKILVSGSPDQIEKSLFRFRQYFSSYRIDEYSYVEKTFEDFKNIIWDFADQLSDEIKHSKKNDSDVNLTLNQLKEAVEANSIENLRTVAREFIDCYVETQTKTEARRTKRMDSVNKSLNSVKKQLMEANHAMMTDHLTGAFNRRCFDEQAKKYFQLFEISKANVSLIAMDIDFFKKVNDTYGHDIGDFVLKECVRVLKEIFARENDFVARVGGEEFHILLPDYRVEHAIKKAEDVLNRIRKEVFITGSTQLRFTVSMGVAQLQPKESIDEWVKRADSALYESKQTGRNKYTVAPHLNLIRAA